jgi:lipoyl(octanoyl) transferase
MNGRVIGDALFGGANSGEPAAWPVSSPHKPPASQEPLPPTPELCIRWLGQIGFAEALTLQEEIVSTKRSNPLAADELLLLEHEPVYTIGRTPDKSSLLGTTHLPYPIFEINRGGQATYHGPGQLVGYPIIDLRSCGQDLHRYLRWLEQALIDLLLDLGIAAARRHGLTGVWVDDDRKIASIGIGVKHWITMHGFALNVCCDLSPFDRIIPCGIGGVSMTSVERELGQPISVIEVASRFENLVQEKVGHLRQSAVAAS